MNLLYRASPLQANYYPSTLVLYDTQGNFRYIKVPLSQDRSFPAISTFPSPLGAIFSRRDVVENRLQAPTGYTCGGRCTSEGSLIVWCDEPDALGIFSGPAEWMQISTPWKETKSKICWYRKFAVANDKFVQAASYDSLGGSILATTEKGHLYGWGHNHWGCLGFRRNSTEVFYQPKRVKAIPKVKSVSMGQRYSVILTEGGEVWGFGNWTMRELSGLTQAEIWELAEPKKILGLPEDGVFCEELTCGPDFVLARFGGELWSWGKGVLGCLGRPVGPNRQFHTFPGHMDAEEYCPRNEFYPPDVVHLCGENARTMSCTSQSCVALTVKGEFFFWGQVNGSKIYTVPVRISIFPPILDSTFVFSCAEILGYLDDEGSLQIWSSVQVLKYLKRKHNDPNPGPDSDPDSDSDSDPDPDTYTIYPRQTEPIPIPTPLPLPEELKAVRFCRPLPRLDSHSEECCLALMAMREARSRGCLRRKNVR